VISGDKRGRQTIAVSFRGAHFPKDVILSCVRKGQRVVEAGAEELTPAAQFYALAV
jgi:hypothetical protein